VTLRELMTYLDVGSEPPALELAGPREKIFFDPSTLACGIVTCGGLCPGINNVIRAVTLSLHYHYGVRRIYGFRYGYEGMVKRLGNAPLLLTPEVVDSIGESGGTILASSRGPQDPAEMVDYLEELEIGILFTIGGDGTLKGAQKIAEELARRGSSISVIGIPKTIDNDISFLKNTFGFETAVNEAHRAIYSAHTEATGARNGIGLVKLMGRDSGFIAADSTLVNSQVNFCLVPESPFSMEGFLKSLEQRVKDRGHAVIVVAEGAGQELMASTRQFDASGNPKLGDIGTYLRDRITEHFKEKGLDATVKYIDPSYMVRSSPAIATDSAYCERLGNNAAHAAMAGRNKVLIGMVHGHYVHIPVKAAVSKRSYVDPEGALWRDAVDATQQPPVMVNPS